ncbi:hypothetical protein B6V72_17225 [Thioclava sp. F34-6]|uniref:sugar ABC transporter substrate-binding protein n=1 Tax=Thioclava sp. F34-6 TaxID=1973003 RepID=UPI000B541CC7|nr:substrate-binding domain-containing protein [Thioclava sp. F34-6]OWY10357.1 hypothetical protein B6V72_17225 [Thioclava sp. F34-6]
MKTNGRKSMKSIFYRTSRMSLLGSGVVLATLTAQPALAQANTLSVKPQKIGYVDLIAAGAMQRRYYSYFVAGAEALGWDVELQDAAGDPTKANTAAISLLNQGIDALVTSCADSAPMRPALQLAKEKGIPTVQIGCPMSDEAAWDLSLPIDDHAIGQALGKFVAAELGDGAKVGILGDTTILAGEIRGNGLKAGLEGKELEIVGERSVSLTDAVGDTRKTVSTYLTANPDLAAVIAVYDFFAPAAGNAIQSAGAEDTVVYSFFADAVNVPYMWAENSRLVAVADGPVEIVSLMAVDQLVRHFESDEPFDSAAPRHKISYEIFTKENLPEESDEFLTPYDVQPYLDEYVADWATAFSNN